MATRVVALTQADPAGEITQWTTAAMAKAPSISISSVQRIWRGHGLQPHRVRQFKLSTNPAFAAKLRDVVGLYVDPSAHAVVIFVDEKRQIQALERHGTTTLLAALDVLEGKVIGCCMQRHRHQEFIRFLTAVEAAVPVGKIVHVILDKYAVRKHPKIRALLGRHPRSTFHFTPTSDSWLNAVEGFFAKLAKRRPRRGVIGSLIEVQVAVKRFIAERNGDPKPVDWTADPDRLIKAAKRRD